MLSDMGQTGFSAQPMPAPTQFAPPNDPNALSGIDLGGPGSSPVNMGAPQTDFQRVVANAERNPKLLGYAAAPAISEELTPAPYNPEKAKVDADMGQRYAFESGYDNSVPGRSAPASYSQIGNTDARRIYGFADGGDVQFPYGESVVRMATGGISDAASHLGSYSDGGRLLRGPGDGVSDSIPAVIGRKQPARLADGEFVVPARIVSEIGNGSTEAGARKLYAMMDRVQKARGKTVGKGKVAKNTRADKYLPA
jgi:hypothetical protein